MYHYRITHEKRCLDGKIYNAYGIAVQEIARIDDIAVSAETLRHLVELCSRLELSPLHLSEVIDDFILSA